MKKLFFCFYFALLQTLCAQNINISGYIEDITNNEKLIGATAVNVANSTGTASNVYGFYTLSIPANIYTQIKFSYLGYQPFLVTVKLAKDSIINCKLNANTTLKEVVISATKQERIENKTEMSRINIPIEQIKNIPALFGEVDVLKAKRWRGYNRNLCARWWPRPKFNFA
jgi:CarboxypepD_reg-like domain